MPEHGIFFTFEELKFIADLLEATGDISHPIYLKVTERLRDISPVERPKEKNEKDKEREG